MSRFLDKAGAVLGKAEIELQRPDDRPDSTDRDTEPFSVELDEDDDA